MQQPSEQPRPNEPAKTPLKEYRGTLHLLAKIISETKLQLQWYDPARQVVVWTETISFENYPDCAAASQIECSGDFSALGGAYFMDPDGFREFVIRANAGTMSGKLKAAKGFR